MSIKLDSIGQNVTKICKICGQEKYSDDFHANGTWTRPECKDCFNYKQSLYMKLRKGQTTPEAGTPCECCGDSTSTLHWDHDHETSKHRGWLCSNCNTGIGKLGDTLKGVQQAVDYLENSINFNSDQEG